MAKKSEKKKWFWNRKAKPEVANSTGIVTFADLQEQFRNIGEYDNRNLSGVYQCIELISNTISKLPFYVIDNKTKDHIENFNLYKLLNLAPNPKMTAAIFKKVLISNLLMDGNAYCLPVWSGLNLIRIELLPSQNVGIIIKENGEQLYIYTNLDGEQKKYRYDEIIHIRINAKDGIKGQSPLTYARLTTEIGLTQEVFQKEFYNNGGRPDGVLKTVSDLSSKEDDSIKDENGNPISLKDRMRAEWKKAHSGASNRFNVAILDNGLEYQVIPQISPADMDFVNSKTTNIEDICRYFNVPPYKLGVGKQTYSNNEQANIEYLNNTIVPIVNQIEQEFTLKLLLNKQVSKEIMIKCNIEAELRGDTGSRADWYQKMQSLGIYSINESRAKENLPAIEYGDARLIGANSIPLERLVKGNTAADTTPNPTEESKEGEV